MKWDVSDINPGDIPQDIIDFVSQRIDSVPHLEAVLLLYGQVTEHWTVERAAARLYVSSEAAEKILEALELRRLVKKQVDGTIMRYQYDPEWDETGQLMDRVARFYSQHLTPLTTLIHSKAPRPVLEFARAFDLKKER
jgi:hypothetical protein